MEYFICVEGGLFHYLTMQVVLTTSVMRMNAFIDAIGLEYWNFVSSSHCSVEMDMFQFHISLKMVVVWFLCVNTAQSTVTRKLKNCNKSRTWRICLKVLMFISKIFVLK